MRNDKQDENTMPLHSANRTIRCAVYKLTGRNRKLKIPDSK